MALKGGIAVGALVIAAWVAPSQGEQAVQDGWLRWRGPQQNGVSDATGLDADWAKLGERVAWTADLHGRGAAVVARYADGPRLFVGGYRGQRDQLVEVLACLDPADGRVLWEKRFPDFLSDIVYDRYAIGAPSVDAQTGLVYWLSAPGRLVCFDRDGNLQWEVSMMEKYGRLTFPNGRTGSPTLFHDLVIVNAITSNWGREGPAKNRLYAFDKLDGQLVWASDPGVGAPFLKDSSFSTPIFDERGGYDLFYVGLGDGNVVAVNANTGEPLWRWQMCVGGVNASPVIFDAPEGRGDLLLVPHGQENLHDTGRGFMAGLDLDKALAAYEAAKGKEGFTPPVALKDDEVLAWRNDEVTMFTSSPSVAPGGRVLQLTEKGHLFSVDAATGAVVFEKTLANSTLHGSPLVAGTLAFVPIWQHGLFVVDLAGEQPRVLGDVKLEGETIGTPTLWGGKLFLHTTAKLYCFNVGGTTPAPTPPGLPRAKEDDAARFAIKPAEVLLRPGERMPLFLRPIGVKGHCVAGPGASWQSAAALTWKSFVPPGARVTSALDAQVDDEGHLVAAPTPQGSAGALRGEGSGMSGVLRGRVLPAPPLTEDFESLNLTETGKPEGSKFAYPPLPWIGARLRWEVREVGGSKVLAKTLDNMIFMRSMVFLGHPDERGYTVAADVMTDGNRRAMSVVGVINQRYLVALDGNKQVIEVSSNHDRVKQEARFAVEPGVWYRLVSRVDVNADGGGVVRAKAWKRSEAEPAAWSFEAKVPYAHESGSPGLYGFSPGNRFAVYVDNVVVEPVKEPLYD